MSREIQNRVRDSLTAAQRKALRHIEIRASELKARARKSLERIVADADADGRAVEAAVENIRSHAQVAISFHPERVSASGESVARGLLKDGVYKSQFETGLSSGSPTAYAGGERDLWEERLYGGAYHSSSISVGDRPKHGALEIMYHPDGAAPRFGSCYFHLRPEVTKRTSLTFGGSHEELAPSRTGTVEEIDCVLAPLFAFVAKRGEALGVKDLSVSNLLAQLTSGLSTSFRDPAERPLGRALDSFIEAQVHGPIMLHRDVERLVLDRAFRGHPIAETLAEIYSNYNIPLYWHPGYTMPVNEVPERFRDYAVRPLAERIARAGTLNAAVIGAAANTLVRQLEAWSEWGPYDVTLTQFRRLWHVLVLHGTPTTRNRDEVFRRNTCRSAHTRPNLNRPPALTY